MGFWRRLYECMLLLLLLLLLQRSVPMNIVNRLRVFFQTETLFIRFAMGSHIVYSKQLKKFIDDLMEFQLQRLSDLDLTQKDVPLGVSCLHISPNRFLKVFGNRNGKSAVTASDQCIYYILAIFSRLNHNVAIDHMPIAKTNIIM